MFKNVKFPRKRFSRGFVQRRCCQVVTIEVNSHSTWFINLLLSNVINKRFPLRTSPRTPVLIDDPLGALSENPVTVVEPSKAPEDLPATPKHELSDNPVLFKRSATFGDSPPPSIDPSALVLFYLILFCIYLCFLDD